MKKAQMQSKLVIYIIVAVVILLLLIFAFVAIAKARDRARDIAQKKLEQEIDASLQEIEYGSVERKQLDVPPGTTEVCFTDITRRTEILTSPIIQADKYTMMRNIIQSGEKKNIFFFVDYEPYIVPIYQSGICFDHYPYFTCIEPRANILNLYIEGKGRCGLIVMEYKICEPVAYDEPNPTTEGTTSNEIKFGSINAKLTIPAGATLTVTEPDTTLKNEICIEATSYIGVEGLISEVYNITPVHIKTDAAHEAIFELRYEDFLLPPNVLPKHIKLKKSSSPWEPITSQDGVDIENKRVRGTTTDLGYVAVFGPEPPTANISVNGGEEIPEGTEAIVAKGSNVIFDASISYDPDDDIQTYSWDFGDESDIEQGGEEYKTLTHAYTMICSYDVTLTVTDETGYMATKKIVVTVVNDANKKDISKLDDIIIISNPVAVHWREILQLVPVAMWKDIDGDQRIPYLVYHKENDPEIDETHFKIGDLKNKYKTEFYPTKEIADVRIGLFTDQSEINTVDGITPKSFETDYFDYWLPSTEDIVVVGYANEEDALIASLFASFINAPIIFIEHENKQAYADAGVFNGKHAYIIGDLSTNPDIHQQLINFIKPPLTSQITPYTADNLKNPSEEPKIPLNYLKLYSKIASTSS